MNILRQFRESAFAVVFLCLGLVFFSQLSVANSAMRIENEYKLTVPNNIAEAVWAYLNERYSDDDQFFLKQYDKRFSSTFSTEYFIDEYYDTPNLKLLAMDSGVRHRTRYIPENKYHRKHGRQMVQIKLNSIDGNVLNRGEIKFGVAPNENKQYLLKHLIDASELDLFEDSLLGIGIHPDNLRPSLLLTQERKRVYISLGDSPFATITLDHVTSKKWWQAVDFFEIEMELNEIAYTDGDRETRAMMEKINDDLMNDLLASFPVIKQDQTPKYNKAFNAFDEKFMLFSKALRLNAPVEVIGATALLLLLLLVWVLVAARKEDIRY